jgi:translation initiation factor IF-2
MRARGAQVTDVVIVVIAVDDDVMPQTKEAIAHAQAANVPTIFAFNKIDKPGANPDKIKEQLSSMNSLAEDWGGKYQSQDVSAKTGKGVDDLLEKVLLESDLLNLTANADKLAKGTVLEASLDKGKGYVTTVLVQEGSLSIGDFMLAGRFTGKVKALFNERDQKVNNIPPSTPVTLLGLNGVEGGILFTF